MSSKTALVTGITGQDGSYLAELLLQHGYRVHGLSLPGADCSLIAPIANRITLHDGAIEDAQTLSDLIALIRPDECYHLAAQTFVAIQPKDEPGMLDANTIGVHRLLSAIREHQPACRVFLAGSAEMFGDVTQSPQNENTVMKPRSFYGVTKTAAYHLLRHFRQSHNLFACCGILYNHESPRRGPQFVTRKITRSAVRIKRGEEQELRLGNLDSARDWGHAADYVRAMWTMLQHPEPDDYVIATGQPRTVRDFVATAFSAMDLDWSKYVVVDPNFYRPLDPCPLVGDASKARKQLNWKPEIGFATLVQEMLNADL